MQRRYNSVEKFTEMLLTTETIVETNGEVVSRSQESQTITGRSNDNLLNPELSHCSSSPAGTVIPITTTSSATGNGVNVKNNFRPSSRTAFYEQQQQQASQQFIGSQLRPLPPYSSSGQLTRVSAEPQASSQVPYRPIADMRGVSLPTEQYSSGSAPLGSGNNHWTEAQRPCSSVNSGPPRQQYYQQPSQYQQQYSPQQQQSSFAQQKRPQQLFYSQQQPLSPQQPQRQPPYGTQGYGAGPVPFYLNGSASPAPTVIRYQQPTVQQPPPPGSQPNYSIQRTPSRSAMSKSRESVAAGDVGETLQFAEHLDAFLENNVPGWAWIALNVLQIVFGLMAIFIAVFNFNLCYAEPKIPVYLLLAGFMLIINGSVRLCLRVPVSSTPKSRIVVVNGCRYKQPVAADPHKRSTFAVGGFARYATEGSILFIMLAVLILGCIWVYGARYIQFEPYRFERNYCQYTLYWVSWWSVTVHLIVMSVFIITVITVLLFGAVMSK